MAPFARLRISPLHLLLLLSEFRSIAWWRGKKFYVFLHVVDFRTLDVVVLKIEGLPRTRHAPHTTRFLHFDVSDDRIVSKYGISYSANRKYEEAFPGDQARLFCFTDAPLHLLSRSSSLFVFSGFRLLCFRVIWVASERDENHGWSLGKH